MPVLGRLSPLIFSLRAAVFSEVDPETLTLSFVLRPGEDLVSSTSHRLPVGGYLVRTTYLDATKLVIVLSPQNLRFFGGILLIDNSPLSCFIHQGWRKVVASSST